jgi:hypothetical protein
MGNGNWVRTEVVQALRQGYTMSSEQACIEGQADAIMDLVERIASETDRFHMFVGWLNGRRLACKGVEEDEGDVNG